MDDEHESSPLNDEEKEELEQRLASDDDPRLTNAERDYLIQVIIDTKRKTKDLLLQKLMFVNEYSKNKRAEEMIEIEAGRVSVRVLELLDALDAAIEETGVFITNIDEGPDGHPSMALVKEFADKRSEETFVLYEYHGYNIVAGFFEE